MDGSSHGALQAPSRDHIAADVILEFDALEALASNLPKLNQLKTWKESNVQEKTAW